MAFYKFKLCKKIFFLQAYTMKSCMRQSLTDLHSLSMISSAGTEGEIKHEAFSFPKGLFYRSVHFGGSSSQGELKESHQGDKAKATVLGLSTGKGHCTSDTWTLCPPPHQSVSGTQAEDRVDCCAADYLHATGPDLSTHTHKRALMPATGGGKLPEEVRPMLGCQAGLG